MRFEVSPPNRPTRIVAGLIIMCFGLGIAAIPGIMSTVGGLGLFFSGLAVVCVNVYQAMEEWLRRRRDPYDLSRLWEDPLPEEQPDEETVLPDDDELVYCHRCGASMDRRFGVCPDCGARLGG